MNILAIDTSTNRASIALQVGAEIIDTEKDNMREHAQFILPAIEKLLAEANTKISSLDGIIFGAGPGSFTGLRVACSVAKGLAFAHDLPLYPASTLLAIAKEALLTTNNQILTIIDARMDEVYWSCVSANLDTTVAQVNKAEDIILTHNIPTTIAGVGFNSFIPRLPKLVQQNIATTIEIYPKARAMLALYADGKLDAKSALNAEPVYVRNKVTHGESRG